jgi:hypothetical protein
MLRFSLFTILALLGCAAMSVSANAGAHDEIICENRSDIISGLASEYSEEPVSMGFTEQGTVIEILAGPNGNWTMIETLPSGQACLVASGEMWRDSPSIAQPSSTSY